MDLLKNKQIKHKTSQTQLEQNMLKNCTFKPKINHWSFGYNYLFQFLNFILEISIFNPRIPQQVIRRWPLLRIDRQHFTDYMECPFRQLLLSELALCDPFIELRLVWCLEWKVPSEHYIKDNATGPDVHSIPVALFVHYFRSHVGGSPTMGTKRIFLV